jgi:23S rRNA pseudouridine1911/1915/1917 synthase
VKRRLVTDVHGRAMYSVPGARTFHFVVDEALAGARVDAALAEAQSLSRAQAQRLIDAGAVRVGGVLPRSSRRLRAGDVVEGEIPAPEEPSLDPEAIPLAIAYEDAHLVVVDKPAGLVVHPAPGHARGTLVHALLHHCRDLSGIGGVRRPGIVHRLDKGTSGLIVAAKSDGVHQALAAQFKAHSIAREYIAIVRGTPDAASGTIDAAIGRQTTDRKRFATRATSGRVRTAVTRWRVEERLPDLSVLRVSPQTGRTHQIRVHLASIGLPIIGDPTYGGRASAREGLDRQALHAAVLGFAHPVTGAQISLTSPLPADLVAVLARARAPVSDAPRRPDEARRPDAPRRPGEARRPDEAPKVVR